MKSNIIQLIPAEGWSAQYASGYKTLIAFALVDHENTKGDNYREVTGLVAEDGNYNPVFAESLPGFQKYRRIYATLTTEDQKPKSKKGLADGLSYI